MGPEGKVPARARREEGSGERPCAQPGPGGTGRSLHVVGLRSQWVCEDAGGHRDAGQKSQGWEVGFHAEAQGLGSCLVAQLVKNLLAWVQSLGWEGKGHPLQYSGPDTRLGEVS